MSSTSLTRYVVTFHYQEKGLTDLNKLTSTITEAGFSPTLNDDEGKPHELGTNSFGIISALEESEIKELAAGFGEIALGERPEVEVLNWEAYQQQQK
ncbi:type V toxin-antitoxin system endoribonuclease antitoxin GhoS [Erwiniaceae bacterium BAC15a-03b]|uniref:Type V toxin-antitoxin system endoribonuclease antitoxin GhoS n=1 Tax=Winslowiella arboricola TaxID=2978220 RepID=A0A9J6PNP7_9GAMM|nr:type V toxin-antitoxin system endoribonuclease antitoxin GhoS [Winslowiella arboricola]MCU5774919.1 type V toxin-antitoxin system endoribonuclease antitoxin GhoS [Winslowiella arboricola]MCU5779929.1 type V toxin-antitoxin system endoribonuclease antitoxin GhoS [Winslowiella arboricola]